MSAPPSESSDVSAGKPQREPGAGQGAAASSPTQAETILRVLRLAVLGIYRSQLPRMAAAMAYRTMFGLIPLFIIGLVVLGQFTSDEDKRDAVTRALKFSGLSEIALESEPVAPPVRSIGAWGPGAWIPPEAVETARQVASAEDFDAALAVAMAPPLGEVADESYGELDAWITDKVEEISSIKLGAIGAVGFLTLVYAAISMLVELERSFNHIYQVRVGRAWTRRLIQYWAILTLGVLSLAVTFGVSENATRWLNAILGVEPGSGSVLGLLLGLVVRVALSTGVFFLLYATVPNTRVHIRPGLTGAAVAAVLWELGKEGFTTYLTFTTVYSSLYGSIGLIPLFLLWVYITWLIILFGLQVSQMLQTFRDWADDGPGAESTGFVSPTIAIDLGVMAARSFDGGAPLQLGAATERLGLSPTVARRVLEAMESQGLLHRVGDEDDGRWTLARPPERVSAAELLGVGEALIDRAEHEPGAADLERRLRQVQRREVEAETLADLVGQRTSRPAVPASSGPIGGEA
ncbi:MAG: YhjD/YihY/BrkB family envelope integrity protein [Planctomycetota bacterium]